MSQTALIVDDNLNNIRLLSEILEDEGFDVHSLNNSLLVLDKAAEVRPDIILLDIMMPERDGFEVCQLLKADSELRDIPIIMVTAKVASSDVKYALI